MPLYLGPHAKREDLEQQGLGPYGPPAGSQGLATIKKDCHIFQADSLGSDYELLTDQHPNDFKPGQRFRDGWARLVGTTAERDTLTEILYETIALKSDPTGDPTKVQTPLPNSSGEIVIYLGEFTLGGVRQFGFGTLKREKLAYSEAWPLAQKRIQEQVKETYLRDPALAGKVRDGHRATLGLTKKDLARITPRGLDVPDLDHESELTDNFNRANSTNIATGGLSWNQVTTADFQIVSNALHTLNPVLSQAFARVDTDLSSANHSTTSDIAWASSVATVGAVCVRFNSSATVGCIRGGATRGTDSMFIQTIASASPTTLIIPSLTIGSFTWTTTLEADGSILTLTMYDNSTITAKVGYFTNHESASLRPGLSHATNTGTNIIWDNFRAFDNFEDFTFPARSRIVNRTF